MLPDHGSVLGIDVGYSPTKKSTGFCHLYWSPAAINWRFSECCCDEVSRDEALGSVLPADFPVLAVAIDGPLRPQLLNDGASYRMADCILSRGVFQKRGKPGQTHTPIGRSLHQHATSLAQLAIKQCRIATATTPFAIHRLSIHEAFPNLFLGVLLDEADYPLRPSTRRRWTDSLYPAVFPKLQSILDACFPDHAWNPLAAIDHHEQIASFTCAMAALCLAAHDCVAVGSASDGFIILPPLRFWGIDGQGDRWAERELRRIVGSLNKNSRSAVHAQIYSGDDLWLSTNSTEPRA